MHDPKVLSQDKNPGRVHLTFFVFSQRPEVSLNIIEPNKRKMVHFEPILKWFWTHFEIILNPFWNDFEMILNPFWNDFEPILKWFWTHFEMIYV